MDDPTKSTAGPAAEAVPPAELLELLVCPLGKKPLRLEGTNLVCTECGLTFRIEDGIPNMLIEDAQLPEGKSAVKELACYEPA